MSQWWTCAVKNPFSDHFNRYYTVTSLKPQNYITNEEHCPSVSRKGHVAPYKKVFSDSIVTN